MSNKTNFKDLNLSNFFLFPTVMEDQELCRDMLELCTGEYVAKVQVHTEENRHYHPHKRALRLDVKAWNSQAKYNTEMQNAHRLKLPKRSPEENFPLRDGTCKIYLNTKGKNNDEVPKELVHFLKYVENSTDECARKYPDDLFLQRLHQKVQEVKRNRDKEMEYMLFGELLDEREELAEERGEEQGSMKTVKLVKRMLDDGLTDDIPKLENTEYRKKMMEKYNLL